MKYGPRRIASNKRNKRPRKRLADKKQGTLCKGILTQENILKKALTKIRPSSTIMTVRL
jgi:hypothetical protein